MIDLPHYNLLEFDRTVVIDLFSYEHVEYFFRYLT